MYSFDILILLAYLAIIMAVAMKIQDYFGELQDKTHVSFTIEEKAQAFAELEFESPEDSNSETGSDSEEEFVMEENPMFKDLRHRNVHQGEEIDLYGVD